MATGCAGASDNLGLESSLPKVSKDDFAIYVINFAAPTVGKRCATPYRTALAPQCYKKEKQTFSLHRDRYRRPPALCGVEQGSVAIRCEATQPRRAAYLATCEVE